MGEWENNLNVYINVNCFPVTRHSKFRSTMSSFEAGFQFLLERPWASLTSLVVAGLVVYYHLKVVAPVKFICKKGSQLEKLFRKSLPVANEMFKPTIWCFEARFQTIFASVCRAFIPDIPYRREVERNLLLLNELWNRNMKTNQFMVTDFETVWRRRGRIRLVGQR